MSEALRAGCCGGHRHRAVLCGDGWKWVLATIANYHDPAWYQHHYNVAYGLYDRGWLNDHDLPRLRPQHCRRHDYDDEHPYNHDGGTDIINIDYDKHAIYDSATHVLVRRDDYDNLVAALDNNDDDIDYDKLAADYIDDDDVPTLYDDPVPDFNNYVTLNLDDDAS